MAKKKTSAGARSAEQAVEAAESAVESAVEPAAEQAASPDPAAAAGPEAPRSDAGGPMPVLYAAPRPLSPERHGGKSLASDPSYAFAARTNAVPLNVAEFTVAAAHYPIVFTPGEGPVAALAVLGLEDASNLFVDESGEWDGSTYVPAYVRRYPFICMTGPERQQYILCVDESSDRIVEGGERPLFENGRATPMVDEIMKFCTAYQQQSEFTRQFTAALLDQDLLVRNRATVTLPSGRKLSLAGFRVIDERKFNELPDHVIVDWRGRGWLKFVYCHLVSMGQWPVLAGRSR